MLTFCQETLLEIRAVLLDHLDIGHRREAIEFRVINPDYFSAHFDGEFVDHDGQPVRYRTIQCWLELAESLRCRLSVPRRLEPPFMQLRFEPIAETQCLHRAAMKSGETEKYGVASEYARLRRFEEPSFVHGIAEAMREARLSSGQRVLILGVNRGDEIEGLNGLLDPAIRQEIEWVGVDHCPSAIAEAENRFAELNTMFHCADLDDFDWSSSGAFDLVVAINTLHSPTLDGQAICRRVVKDVLTANGTLILGFPNCRYENMTLRYGARVKNYAEPEFSTLFRQVSAFRRYLNQQGFKTRLTGKYTWLLAGHRPKLHREV